MNDNRLCQPVVCPQVRLMQPDTHDMGPCKLPFPTYDMSMLSVPSASALSSLIVAYLAAMVPAKTVLLMNCLKGAHDVML